MYSFFDRLIIRGYIQGIFGLSKAGDRPELFSSLGIKPEQYFLLTLHRPYNVDDPQNLAGLLKGLNDLDKPVVFPIHPRTRAIMRQHAIAQLPNIISTPPLGYQDFLVLQKNAAKIITDSGGIQKEAYLSGTPCITIRPETEWIETVEAGWNLLLDWKDPEFLSNLQRFSPQANRADVFGRDVARKMVEELRK